MNATGWRVVGQRIGPLLALALPGAALAQSFSDCKGCPDMVVVPAGTQMIGSAPGAPSAQPTEQPQHAVTIARPFAMGVREVSFDEWSQCVKDGWCNRYMPNDNGWGTKTRPVFFVSYADTQMFVAWLNQKLQKNGLPPYRLPSEAEWEYAARLGQPGSWSWGGQFVPDMANCTGCCTRHLMGMGCGNRTLETGKFPPGNAGLRDVAGNVAEWVQDCWNPNYAGAPTDGSAWSNATCASGGVIRGGSWNDPPSGVRLASRQQALVTRRSDTLGFRVARDCRPGARC